MADDLTRPFIGYRSAGRRPESQQDRRAAADAPLSALRGAVSGVLGAPGDIESLIRMLPGLSEQTVLPTSEDVEKRLPMRELNQTPTGKAFTTAGQLGGGFYTGPGSPLRAVAALPSAVSRAGRDFAMAAGQPAVNVVKPKGGNWLAGSVEHAVEPMQKRVTQAAEQNFNPAQGMTFREIYSQDALNKWLETKLGKYIRNEMATPEDPLRALAERGIMHSEITPTGYNVARARKRAGFPEEGMGVSPMAKAWEDRADTFVNELEAFDLTSAYPEVVKDNPWLLKVPPETRVYDMLRGADEDLGFSHLTDELRNAINPESGLPRELMLKYSDLEKVTVPQAVERVAKINEWRAAQKAEADMARAMGPATQVVKEYPEQGYKWVELRQPTEAPQGWSVQPSTLKEGAFDVVDPRGQRSFGGDSAELAQSRLLEKGGYSALEDALKYEGETMGHCVGGYCPDVVEGRSKIYSLRDKKGQPHVTIEVKPGGTREIPDNEYIRFYQQAAEQMGIPVPRNWNDMPSEGYNELDKLAIRLADEYKKNVPDEIVQIKGKGNKAPKEDYLPAVQDFVRSGNWGRVGDLKNAGLIDARAAGNPLPGRPAFMTEDEFKAFQNELSGETPTAEGFSRGGAVRGYQAGGIVKAAKKTARSLGDLVDEYVRKVRKFDELGEPSYDVKKPEAPTSADVPGWHITQDLASILKAGAIDNRLAGSNMQGYDPAHLGGAYFYSDPRLSLAQHQRLMDMVGSDPAYAAELPILRAQLRRGNRLVPDEDVGLNVPWQQSYQEGSFATKRPVLINQIDRIYSADPGVTKDMIRDTIIRQRRPGYAEGGAVTGANFPTDDYDPARIDAIVAGLQAEMQS
jgi:hypothetical protein